MRIMAKVYGVGPRKKGISKSSSKPYEFTEISIGYEHHMFQGLKCETVPFYDNVIGDRTIVPGDDLDLVIHQANFKTYVDAII